MKPKEIIWLIRLQEQPPYEPTNLKGFIKFCLHSQRGSNGSDQRSPIEGSAQRFYWADDSCIFSPIYGMAPEEDLSCQSPCPAGNDSSDDSLGCDKWDNTVGKIFLTNQLFYLIYLLLVVPCLCCSLRGLSPILASRGYSLLQWEGFSLLWLLFLQSKASRHLGFSSCSTRALEYRPFSCDTQA